MKPTASPRRLFRPCPQRQPLDRLALCLVLSLLLNALLILQIAAGSYSTTAPDATSRATPTTTEPREV